MPIVEIDHISKSFGKLRAVSDVSLTVNEGEFFGLLGPNGAGKTTIIRILLDIFKADAGKVSLLGGAMTEAKKDLIGYMPEERGLYQDLSLERVLRYLGSLKSVPPAQLRDRLDDLLARFDLADWRKKKVKELSKGMQQKAQIIATILHQPKLLIIDEPFSGLDPVNTQMVKDLLRDLHRQGATIIMSTHQMHQVEELCERILLIDHGQTLLYGSLNDIRRRFSGHALLVRSLRPLPEALPGVTSIRPENGALRLELDPAGTPQAVLRALVERDVPVEQFEVAIPTLDEIFIRVVKDQAAQVSEAPKPAVEEQVPPRS